MSAASAPVLDRSSRARPSPRTGRAPTRSGRRGRADPARRSMAAITSAPGHSATHAAVAGAQLAGDHELAGLELRRRAHRRSPRSRPRPRAAARDRRRPRGGARGPTPVRDARRAPARRLQGARLGSPSARSAASPLTPAPPRSPAPTRARPAPPRPRRGPSAPRPPSSLASRCRSTRRPAPGRRCRCAARAAALARRAPPGTWPRARG